jgi:hypothetical protein
VPEARISPLTVMLDRFIKPARGRNPLPDDRGGLVYLLLTRVWVGDRAAGDSAVAKPRTLDDSGQ